jgi:RNA polymerase sigma factor (sigma-70 family)
MIPLPAGYIELTLTTKPTLTMNEKLIVDYMPLANKLAWQKSMTTPKSVTFDELKSAAYMGLVDAAIKFDPGLSSFPSYARIRISGAIKDHLKHLSNYGSIRPVREDDAFFSDNDEISTNDFFDFAASKLEESDGNLLKMYYVEQKTLKEIGVARGVGESRVSQIISKCHRKLRRSLENKI